ncbi:MAG: hypothetical protein AAGL96_10085 [Pseudomonadota bacterium]
MTLLDQLLGRLHISSTLPEVVTRVVVTVQYTPEAVARNLPVDRQSVWDLFAEDLAVLLGSGYLSRPFQPQVPATVTAVLEGAERLVITINTTGAHVNLVHALIRMVLATHQTPADAAVRLLVEAGGDDVEAAEAYNHMVFDTDIGAVMVQVKGPDGLEPIPVDIRGAIWHNVHVPPTGPLGGSPVIEADEITFSNLTFDDVNEDVEDAFLSVSGMNAFIPTGFDAANEPGEEEVFVPARGTAVVQNVSIEQIYLFELLATFNGGDISRTRAEVTLE